MTFDASPLHPTRLLFKLTALLLACMGFTVSGCGPERAKAVKVELARETLIEVLEHWKAGGNIEELRDQTPEIVVQEPAWARGNKLVDYSLGEGRAEDANWFCEVELTLEPPEGGQPTKKKITYVVGTDPVLTVFHAIL